ncbi:MAG TPA: hypothetical protein VG053_09755 [Solirubrobacteraceae bacterium]|nr:hypothetical protein [Solirubrobacteraceae bacterium]
MTASTLSLNGWGDIAQFVIAIGGVLALVGAFAQLRLSRANARRGRVYEYADRFNDPKLLRAAAGYKEFWKSHTFTHFDSLDLADQLECLMLPNLIEEVAVLYNRNLLDRNLAAQLLGPYVEVLWQASTPLVSEVRQKENRPTIYAEWEEMRDDTPDRRTKVNRQTEKRRARRKFFRCR